MEINIKINDIPVKLEVKEIGPASPEEIEILKEMLLIIDSRESLKEDAALFDFQKDDPPKTLIKSISVSTILSILKFIKQIFGSNKDTQVIEGKKPWFKSKTIWTNLLATLVFVTCLFISESPETSALLPASLVAVINIYLRIITRVGVEFPIENKSKKR